MTFPAVLNLVAWNCYVGNSDTQVVHTLQVWADRLAPDVFALSEASAHADVLDLVEGYSVLQETPARRRPRGDDTGDVALLVADHVKVRRSWVAIMTRTWMVLRYRRRHEPHRYEVASLKVRGHRWRVRASHWPTHGFEGPNREAFLESAKRSRRWLRLSLRRPSIDVGDLNEKIGALAAWFGPRFGVFGSGIDVAVTRNVAGCEWSELGKGGSDHHGRRYQFESAITTGRRHTS